MVLITWVVILASSYLPATSSTPVVVVVVVEYLYSASRSASNAPGTAEVAAERKLQSTLSWHRHMFN